MGTASPPRVHGLAGDEVAPDWPPLTEPEVKALLARFPACSGRVRVTWTSPRPLSAAALVATSAGNVFVKRHHVRVRTLAALAEEHAFLAHLRARGAPVPAVLADREGRTAVASGDWVYEVHAQARGLDLHRDTPSWTPLTDLAQARSAGRALARLHRAAAGYGAPQRTTRLLVARDDLLRAPDLIAALEAELPARPALAEYLATRPWQVELQPILARQRALAPRLAGQARLWTHNDWHVSNLFWTMRGSRPEVSAIVDFGLASPTFALFDLTTAIERNAIAWLQLDRGTDAAFPATARALVEGYAAVSPLSAADRGLLADLLPVVHVDFALSEVEYFAGITHSWTNADVAFDTFLLGHAAWFDTAPGQMLLGAVRAP